MEYKIILCDDEKIHREILSEKIEKYFRDSEVEYEIIETSGSEKLMKYEGIRAVDIVFLDIELGGIKGIDLSKKLKEVNEKALIVFVTSHLDYVLEAFDQFAFNYIMKPIDSKKFKRIMDKALENIKNRRKSSVEKFFNVIYKKKMTSIPYKKIILFEKKVNNLVMILENNKLEIRSNFKIVEEEIDMNFFLRCHKSFIVNKERIIVQQGNYLILIGHNEKIPIGEKYRDHVNTEISKMLRGRRG